MKTSDSQIRVSKVHPTSIFSNPNPMKRDKTGIDRLMLSAKQHNVQRKKGIVPVQPHPTPTHRHTPRQRHASDLISSRWIPLAARSCDQELLDVGYVG